MSPLLDTSNPLITRITFAVMILAILAALAWAFTAMLVSLPHPWTVFLVAAWVCALNVAEKAWKALRARRAAKHALMTHDP